MQKFNYFREDVDKKELLEIAVNLDKLCLTFGLDKLKQMNEQLSKASQSNGGSCLRRLAAIFDE